MFAFSLTEFDPLFNIIQRIATRVTANYFHLPFLRLAAVLDGVIIAVYLCRDWRLMRWTREFLRRFVKVEIIAPLPVPHRFLTALFIAVFVFSAAYFFHQNFDIQFVQIIAHRQFFTDGGLNAIIGDFVSAPLGLAVVAVGLLLIIERLRVRFERKFFFALIPVIGLIAVGAVGFYTGAIDYFRQQSQPPSTFYEEHYLDPKEIKISFSDKKRNLLVIFVESLETGFLPTTDGGAWREDCLPNVKEIAATDLNFSQNDYLGGAAQLAGTGWTLAAIVSYFTGVPEIIPFIGGNDLDKLGEKFMPGTVALGDILTANGYRNYFLCGSEAAFAGRDKFFKTHGDATIYDYNYFRDHRYFPADYRVWWGFEDRKLYAYAQEKLTAAAQADAPFCFTMLTVDTHPVGGYLDPQADKKLSSPFRNVVADADKLLGEFIAWLKQQEFYENTTVVILGDHLYMDNTVFPTAVVGAGEKSDDDRFGNGARRPLNIFINSPLSPKFAKNRQFSHFDIFPTLVEAVGGKIAAPGLGLGRSMSSGEKTLLEELGYDAVNDQLKRPSRRYDELWINNSGGGGGKTEKLAPSVSAAATNFRSTLIAHAGGALFDERGKMLTYTNSREALDENYAKGHRVFEIDFFLTEDEKLAAAHDWEHGRNITGGKWKTAPTRAEWLAQKIYGKYTPMDIDEVVKFLASHPDAFIVTDTKATDRETVAREFAEIFRATGGNAVILDRFIPQIYHPQMLEWLDKIYRFPAVIYTLYQSPQTPAQVVAFVAAAPRVKAVTMWAKMATPEFIAALKEFSRPVYCHTINDPTEAEQLRGRGVFGLYTDSLLPRK